MFKTEKQHIAYIGFIVIMAAFSAGSIVSFTDPKAAGANIFIFLYASIFLFTLGIFTLTGLAFRQWILKGVYIVNLANSFRQALLLAMLVTASLALSAQNLLHWWVEGSLILLLVAIEAFLSVKR